MVWRAFSEGAGTATGAVGITRGAALALGAAAGSAGGRMAWKKPNPAASARGTAIAVAIVFAERSPDRAVWSLLIGG
ncbi:hypothetical protein Cba03nite_51520 [Catellatospora bangladeshensis]|uniref:Uncharacterized protein n=1 Tax=Catellatospora bangladeshensis TaxID=310355 RepID=A0A8J3NL80_9ACTN|nr:hypothetical protein Cba03nite_51520 [Catellatospora bangladeshensis]